MSTGTWISNGVHIYLDKDPFQFEGYQNYLELSFVPILPCEFYEDKVVDEEYPHVLTPDIKTWCEWVPCHSEGVGKIVPLPEERRIMREFYDSAVWHKFKSFLKENGVNYEVRFELLFWQG